VLEELVGSAFASSWVQIISYLPFRYNHKDYYW
jgi:hypothetical protein